MNVDKSSQRIRRMFGEISPRYDFLNHLLSFGTDCYWRWRTVRRVRLDGDGPVLDVCTGTGDLAFAYSKRAGGRATVVGTDFTHDMLTRALNKQAKRRHSGGGPVRFLEADTLNLPFPDDRFEIVSVAFGLRNVSDTQAGLAEMVRVCRPGGRVAVLEFSTPSNAMLRRLYGVYFRRVLPRIGQLFSPNRQDAYDYLPQSVAEFPEAERFAEQMRSCGLDPVAWTPLTFGIASLYFGTKPAAPRRETNASA